MNGTLAIYLYNPQLRDIKLHKEIQAHSSRINDVGFASVEERYGTRRWS
jgi:hypothetical protein